ncbi:hypothetical protein MMC16_000350 [Acarospora aff. strigata]|nr:hypothetical protein [Acarospora aff. strigata]
MATKLASLRHKIKSKAIDADAPTDVVGLPLDKDSLTVTNMGPLWWKIKHKVNYVEAPIDVVDPSLEDEAI